MGSLSRRVFFLKNIIHWKTDAIALIKLDSSLQQWVLSLLYFLLHGRLINLWWTPHAKWYLTRTLLAFCLCRTGAYTCFNQKIGAEEYNYGSRIDHILISGSCLHHCDSAEDHSIFYCNVEECEIMNHFKRGNSENLSK